MEDDSSLSASSSALSMKLYSYWESSCSWRVRFALKLKGLPYEYKPVDLGKGEQLSPEFEKISPLHYVPVLVDDGVVVSDSLAILMYLEDRYPQNQLLPTDPCRRAVNLQAASIVNCNIQSLHMKTVLGSIENKLGKEECLAWAQQVIEKGFTALEKLLKDCAGSYSTGGEVSMADVFLAPQISLAISRFHIDMDVTAKIISFCQQGPRAICILSANGMVSNATLRQSDSSGGTLTYEGRFEIVNLCGSFTPTEREGTRYRAGGLSVSLSSPNGQVVGGCVAGLLIAASTVQIIVGSFLPSNPPELKPKKQKVLQSAPTPFTITAAPPPASAAEKEACNGQGHNNPIASMQSLNPPASFQRENWPNTHSMQERRTATTDINISLPGGLQ